MPPARSDTRILYGAFPACRSSSWADSTATALFRARSTEYMHVNTTWWMRFWRHCKIKAAGCAVTSEVLRLMLEGMCPPTQSRPRTSTMSNVSRTVGSFNIEASTYGSKSSNRWESSHSTRSSPRWSPCCKKSTVGSEEAVSATSESMVAWLLRGDAAFWMFLKEIASSFSTGGDSSASVLVAATGPFPPTIASIEALRIRFLLTTGCGGGGTSCFRKSSATISLSASLSSRSSCSSLSLRLLEARLGLNDMLREPLREPQAEQM
mmetsp:Transcript_99931/g.322204  ORF Transcript_99931/g.322204 Transcript_99931/m.322204 type:complete len:265 (-) Transcript_99931:2325-3119(-)